MTPEAAKEVWNESIRACQKKIIDGYFLWGGNGTSVSFDVSQARLFIISKALEELIRK